MFRITVCAMSILLAAGATLATADVLGFEELDTPWSVDELNYGGFTSYGGLNWYSGEYPENDGWDNNAGVYSGTHNGTAGAEGNGYQYGVINGSNAYFSPWGSAVEISTEDGGLISMDSIWMTSVWNTNLDVAFMAYRDGSLVGSYDLTLESYDVPEFVVFDESFRSVAFDTLIIDSSGGTLGPFTYESTGAHFIMDDFAFSNAIPAPASLCLLGLAGIGVGRRRRG